MYENNNNISDISTYQRYLMTLKALEEEQHQKEWDAFIRKLLEVHGIEDDFNASPEALAKVDLEIAMARYPLLLEAAPNASKQVEEQIGQALPYADEILMQAGYEDELRTDNLLDHVATMHVAEQTFPDENRPSLVERLKNAKGHIASALKSENGSLALSTVMFSVAVGTGGGAALAVSGALYAANLMKNSSVQNFMSRIESKVSDTLVRFGFKEENVEERKVSLGERMKAITSNRWFKATTAVAAVGLLGVGVGSLLSNGGYDAIKEGVQTVWNADYSLMASEASADLKNLAVGAYEGAASLGETASSVYESISASASEVATYLGDSAEQAYNAASTTAEAVYDKATELVSGDAQPLAEAQPTNETTVRASGPALGDDLVPDGVSGSESAPELTEGDIQQGHVEYVVKEGDNAWNIVKEYLTTASGEVPTDAQIDTVVDSLNLENPDLIYPGDVINLPADPQNLDFGVSNDVAIDDPFVADEPPEFGGVVPSEVDISRYVDFEEILKVHGLYESITLSELQMMNPDLDFGNLSPGDTMTLHPDSDMTYTVPSVEQMIIETAFPQGAPEHLDTSKFVDDVMSLNETHNLKEGWFGVQALNGNPLLGQEILNNGVLKTPEVDLSSLTPDHQGQVNVSGRNVAGALDREIIEAAFPNGAPTYLDESSFIASVKEANSGLAFVQEGDYFNESLVIPGSDASQSSHGIVQDFDKDEAINSFRDRFAALNKGGYEPS